MANKGTQALLKSDISLLKELLNDVEISASTTDIEGVKRLDLPLKPILSPLVDIPYEKADSFAKKIGYNRNTFMYKVYFLFFLTVMFMQASLSIVSAILVKAGIRPIYRTKLFKILKECDIIVSCSDENFKEGASELPLNIYWIITWWTMLFARTWDILIAKKFFGKPVVIFPNSIGPFRTGIGRFLSRLSLNNCDCILVRDPISYDIVRSLKLKPRKILTSDTALLFKPKQETLLHDFSSPVIGVSPGIYSHSLSRKEVNNYILAHAKALDMAIEKYRFDVVFFPHYVTGFPEDDLAVCRLILNKMKHKSRAKIINTNSVEEFKSFLNQMDILISSKMHPAVLGFSGLVPILCIVYDHKQIGFLKELGMLDYVLYLREVSYEKIISKIDLIWNKREKIRVSLGRRVPALQELIKRTVKQAIDTCLTIKQAV
jgi:polysaccharide pyruvyl transferase WcaK-like protein